MSAQQFNPFRKQSKQPFNKSANVPLGTWKSAQQNFNATQPSCSKSRPNPPEPKTQLDSTGSSMARKQDYKSLNYTQAKKAFQVHDVQPIPKPLEVVHQLLEEDVQPVPKPLEVANQPPVDDVQPVPKPLEVANQPPVDDVEPVPKPLEVVHELTNRWTFWYFEYEPNKSLEKMIYPARTFQYAEEFWYFYRLIKQPMELKYGCNYSLFKEGIRPLAKDPANLKGGRWLLKLNNSRAAETQAKWLDVMLCMIGGQIDEDQQLCGAQVNVSNVHTKIGIWTSLACDKKVLTIGRKLQKALELPKGSMSYEPNTYMLKKVGTYLGPLHVM